MTLYLKYRPLDFSSLVGQEFTKETLKTAVEQDKTVGAYLFTGPRGTGKTSTARIFAKAINCQNKTEGNPCGSCEICVEFSKDSLIDVIEIDAASHTWVDNIREIIEKAQFQPTKTQYKIYIIDEVHMLSKGAFNALLKILEEPPKHVKFILATTEIHKVPDTILSRCQRYDFRSITPDDIKTRLEYIATEEKVEVDDESYNYIVKQAEWGLRNAISLFEQLISDKKITFEHISKTLWIISEDAKNSFLLKLQWRDISVLEDFEDLKNSGKNLKIFFKELSHKLQEETIEKLKQWEDVMSDIQLLDQLQDILWKLKNSFDETLTLKTGLLKILAGYSIWTITAETPRVVMQTPTAQKSIKTPQEEKVEIKTDTTSDMLKETQNIFAVEEIWAEPLLQTSSNWFDIEGLIKEVKKQWAKAALTMSLRWSVVSLNGSTLDVKSKTRIAAESIGKNENKEYIQRAAEALGIQIDKIEIL